MNNNPPEVVLELSKEQAEILLESCRANIHAGLVGIMMVKDRKTQEALVVNNMVFNFIRAKLEEQLQEFCK